MDLKTLTKEVEKVSKQYASEYKIKRNDNWYILKLQEELGELIQAFLILKGQARPKGKSSKEMKKDFEKEVADVFCHVILLAKHHKINLEKIVEKKWLFWTKRK